MDLWRKWSLDRIIKKIISKNFNSKKIYIYIYNKNNLSEIAKLNTKYIIYNIFSKIKKIIF